MALSAFTQRRSAAAAVQGCDLSRPGAKRSGVTVAEFALVAPLVFLLIFGFMEGGRIYSAWLIVTNESREAARVASVLAGQVADPGADACAHAMTRANGLLETSRLTCSAQSTTDINGNLTEMTLTLLYSVDLVIPLIVPVYELDPFPIAAQATVRPE